MARFLLSLTFTIATFYVMAQEPQDTTVYKVVELMPVFPGGDDACLEYLQSARYPNYVWENDIEVTPYVYFVIEKDGVVSNVTIARHSAHFELDTAAINHIKATPQWTPGSQRGKMVRVEMVVPVKFKL